MRVTVTCLTAFLLVLGCAWSPSRDNPVDPESDIYVPPQPRNNAPAIDTVYITTDCWSSEINTFCWFDVVSRITDFDGNLKYDSVMAAIEELELGPMSYDPTHGEFRLRRPQTEMPNDNLNDLVGKVVTVSAADDSGAHDAAFLLFPAPVVGPEPIILYPGDPSVYTPSNMDQVVADSVRLGWQLWLGSTGDHHFSVSVYYRNAFLSWDITGLAPSDTFVVVTDSLVSNPINLSVFYTWYLTVTDRQGNRITSLPGYFRYFRPDGLSPALKPEHLAGD